MQPAGAQGPAKSASWRLPVLIVVVALLVVAAGAVALKASGNGNPAPTPPSTASAAPGSSAGPAGSAPGTVSATDQPGTTTTPSQPGGSTATPGPVGNLQMPMVPVVSFWSTQTDISSADLAAALGGTGPAGQKVVVLSDDADAIGSALGVTVAGSVQRAKSPDKVRKAVSGGALGVLRASDVDPSVRALSIDGKALFGEVRVKDAADWPFIASIEAPSTDAWDQGTAWTMLAGGDMFMDRGVYREVVQQKKGVDWPFDGGTAVVTGHHCCGVYVTTYKIPDVQLTGNQGAVRDLVKNADLAVANLETPVPDNWVYHAHDYIFSSDPALLPMFTNAGIDFVTIANNHIKDAGSQDVVDLRKNLADAGLKFAGAGDNLAEAGQIAYLHANGTTVGIIGCQGVSPAYYATDSSAGALPCTVSAVVPRIQEAKTKADLVIVFAHWGKEYDNNPQPGQQPLAKAWIDAGAGLILGAHTHVPGAIDEIDGKVVFYSLGNFIFDQTFRTATMESALPELTFQGNRLVQIRLHPYVAPDVQPNLLNPATDDGKAVMDTIRQVSQANGLQW